MLRLLLRVSTPVEFREGLTALSILIRVQSVTVLHDLFLIMSIGYMRFFKTFDKWPLFIY